MKHIRTISMLVLSSMLITSLAGCSSNKQSMEEIIATAESAVATPTPVPGNPEQAIITSGDIVFKKITDEIYTVDNSIKYYEYLKYNYQPNDVNIAVEEWSSSDENVATVSDDGKLAPVGFGECDITLHITDGLTDGAYASIHVTVEDAINRLDDKDIPDYDTLLSNSISAYKDVDDYDDCFFINEPFSACYNEDNYNHIDDVSRIIDGYNTPYMVFVNDNYSVVVAVDPDSGSGMYWFGCDGYDFFYFGEDDETLDYDMMKDMSEATGLPIPDEEAVSELFQ